MRLFKDQTAASEFILCSPYFQIMTAKQYFYFMSRWTACTGVPKEIINTSICSASFHCDKAAETQNSSVPVYVFGLISAVIG